jgi:hypothetical protein
MGTVLAIAYLLAGGAFYFWMVIRSPHLDEARHCWLTNPQTAEIIELFPNGLADQQDDHRLAA